MKNWVVAVGVVVGLGALMYFSDRPAKTPEGADLIRSPEQYKEVFNKAAAAAVPIMQQTDNGAPLTKEMTATLRESAKSLEAATIYDPSRVIGQYYLGRCWLLLGEKVKAGQRFEQAIVNLPRDPERTNQFIQLTTYDAMGLLSEVCLDLSAEELANANSASQSGDIKGAEESRKRAKIYLDKAFTNADSAVRANPKDFRYFVDRANTYLAMGNKPAAKLDITKALQMAPNDPRVKSAAIIAGLVKSP